MQEFLPGQRWINNAELQMGLGTILSCEHRTVTISFPAAGETRTYAKQTAPLSRIIFSSGDQLETEDGRQLIVSTIQQHDGLISYQCVDQHGASFNISEQQLNPFVKLTRPAERLFHGQIDHQKWFNLRFQTLQELSRQTHSELYGLLGCRTSLLPHQLYIAHEVANRHAPRVLLADEVGLGKTIEAGLIIHHQLLREHARRILIIVPESLIHQWLVEMLRRFNLLFSIFDQQRYCAMCTEDQQQTGEDLNPFLDEQQVLCSLEYLTDNTQVYQHLLHGEWDLLVVDEAHHLQWSPTHCSDEYQLIEQLALKIRSVLLLTATPEQLGKASHFARLRQLDADRFSSLKEFIAAEKSYQPIAQAVENLLSNEMADAVKAQLIEPSLLAQISAEQDNQQLLEALSSNAAEVARQARQELVAHLLDRHGTGRILFRNTRSAIKGFPQRTLHAYPLELPQVYHEQFKACHSETASEAEKQPQDNDRTDLPDIEMFIFPERLYRAAINSRHNITNNSTNNRQSMNLTPSPQQHADWTHVDPRSQWLKNWLFSLDLQNDQDRPINKILIITAHLQTAKELAAFLRISTGIHAALFHEELSLLERDRAAAFFADQEHGSRIMICSEIGSEGRNFQFAHHMVLFDLPLNPDLLEQRIGRLDRIGQSETINIHVPYLLNSGQNILFRWYHEALDAFEHICPASQTVFTQLKPELFAALIDPDADVQPLINKARNLHAQLKQSLHDGRDRLLEYNSCRQPMANDLYTQAVKADKDSTLPAYMDRVFDAYGVQTDDHSEHCYIITPGEQMLTQFPGLPDDGLTITYDRDTALANEDIHFLTWEHPMVIQAMDMIKSNEMGNTAITTIKTDFIPPGTLLMETLFVLETAARGDIQADRYLPPTAIRIVVDANGNDYTRQLSADIVDQEQQAISSQTALQIIQAKEDSLRNMLKKSAANADLTAPAILAEARQCSHDSLQSEIDRLRALTLINPAIRPEEIDFFIRQQQMLEYIFHSAKPRLDALRVMIAT